MNTRDNKYKILNIIFTVFGVVATVFCYRNYLFSSQMEFLGAKELLIHIVTYLNMFVIFLVFFLDVSKKRIPSLIAIAIMLVVQLYTFKVVYLSYLIDAKNLSGDIGRNFTFSVVFYFIGVLLVGILLLQYLLKQEKNNAFWKYNVFFIPLIDLFANAKWFNEFSGAEYWQNMLENFKGYYKLTIVWLLLAIVFYVRYMAKANLED